MLRQSTIFVMCGAALLSAAPRQEQLRSPDSALMFEPNQGQAPADVKWLAHGRGYQLLLGEEGATIVLAPTPSPAPTGAGVVRMKLKGSSSWQALTGVQATGGYSNYFFGND